MDNDFFASASLPASRFSSPPGQLPVTPPAPEADPVATSTRWHATATTFGPWVKVPITLLVLLLALWSPVHGLLSSPPPPSASASTFDTQVAHAVGGGLLSTATTQAAVHKATALVGSGTHALGTAVSAWTWSWHLLVAAVLLFFLWQPGRRIGRR